MDEKIFQTLRSYQSNIKLENIVYKDETYVHDDSSKIYLLEEVRKIKKIKKQPRGISRNKICIIVATDTEKSISYIVCHGRSQRKLVYNICKKIEKVFRIDKSYLGNDVLRIHDTQRLESKVFISFIAMILRNEIYRSMKGLYKKNRKEYTVLNVLRELDKLRITKLSDEKYHIRYNLTNKQKAILKEINEITEKEYIIFAKKHNILTEITSVRIYIYRSI